jgi:NAD(P)-dependent dehydrogenase (short-subunit alcohol dehydrogenase family)
VSRPPFARAYGPWAVVAGGSAGLGAAFATEIAHSGVHLVVVARRPESLEPGHGIAAQAAGSLPASSSPPGSWSASGWRGRR